MASTSALSDEEICEFLTNAESDDDFDDLESEHDDLGSEHESDNGRDSPEPPKKKKKTPAPYTFQWKKCEDGEFSGTEFHFDESKCGISEELDIELDEHSSEVDFFKILFPLELVEHIVEQTNLYYQYVVSQKVLKQKSKLQKWTDITVSELYSFLALFMLIGHCIKNRMKDYWTVDSMTATPFFGKCFSHDRFRVILSMLHFADNRLQPENNRLFKIEYVVNSVKSAFLNSFCPYQKLCIDESMIVWKGRLSFKQYIPSKRHRFGVKLFVLCDCKSGYILDFLVYCGTRTQIVLDDALGYSGSVVNTLLEKFLAKGHILYIDNWYSSPTLSKFLFGTCGTVRSNRKGMPTLPTGMKKGEVVHFSSENILCTKWHDKRDVVMLSTVSKSVMENTNKKERETGEFIQKPASVLDYNTNMGLVDKSDMQMSFTDSTRKSIKWYKKVFFHLLDMVLLNSFILYKQKTGKRLQLLDFRTSVIRGLIEQHAPVRKSPKGGRQCSGGDTPLRLTARHFPSPVPSTPAKRKPQRQCHVCRHTTKGVQKRKDTTYQCAECDVGLCISPCFEFYHTINIF